MRRLPLGTRRQILKSKLRGKTNREIADEVGVGIGTVSNILAEARQGEYEEFDELSDHIDALLELANRLNAEEVDVTAAHVGLDVLSWTEDLGLEPGDIENFSAEIKSIARGDIDLQSYAPALLTLREIEEHVGTSIEGELGEVLTDLANRDAEDLRRLERCSQKATDLTGGIDHLDTAIEQAVKLQNLGFSLSTAEEIATEVDLVSAECGQDAVGRLVSAYEEYTDLSDAVEKLTTEKRSLQARIEDLKTERAELEEDRTRLQDSVDRLQSQLEILEDRLENLNSSEANQEEDIALRRSQLEAIEADLQEETQKLQAMQDEREVVHAYRRFLRDAELSASLLRDLDDLLEIRSGDAPESLEEFQPGIQERTTSELRSAAMELFEGEEMVPISEHERKLREKGQLDGTLAELQTEREALSTFLQFLETGDISEDLLDELLQVKRGRTSHLESWEESKTEEVRAFLVEQMEELTEGREVIDVGTHRDHIEEVRDEYISELQEAHESIIKLSESLTSKEESFDDELISRVADQIVAIQGEGDAIDSEHVQQVISDAFDDIIERRAEARCSDQVSKAKIHGFNLARQEGIVPIPRRFDKTDQS